MWLCTRRMCVCKREKSIMTFNWSVWIRNAACLGVCTISNGCHWQRAASFMSEPASVLQSERVLCRRLKCGLHEASELLHGIALTPHPAMIQIDPIRYFHSHLRDNIFYSWTWCRIHQIILKCGFSKLYTLTVTKESALAYMMQRSEGVSESVRHTEVTNNAP